MAYSSVLPLLALVHSSALDSIFLQKTFGKRTFLAFKSGKFFIGDPDANDGKSGMCIILRQAY